MKRETETLILESKIKWLKEQQKTGKNHDEDFAKEIASYYNSGKIVEKELLDIQNLEGFGIGVLTDIIVYIKKPGEIMTFGEAREIAQRIQPIYLSYHMKQGRTDGTNLFRESMQPYEEAIDAIHNGTYDSDKLAVLKSLPSIDKWDHDLAVKAYPKIF